MLAAANLMRITDQPPARLGGERARGVAIIRAPSAVKAVPPVGIEKGLNNKTELGEEK
jgi:hypothetical protein